MYASFFCEFMLQVTLAIDTQAKIVNVLCAGMKGVRKEE